VHIDPSKIWALRRSEMVDIMNISPVYLLFLCLLCMVSAGCQSQAELAMAAAEADDLSKIKNPTDLEFAKAIAHQVGWADMILSECDLEKYSSTNFGALSAEFSKAEQVELLAANKRGMEATGASTTHMASTCMMAVDHAKSADQHATRLITSRERHGFHD
jgi:hypothetical protein